MDKFYIDREFGVAIFIDVENGIVKNIYNEKPEFIKRMTELYVGKSISYLKEDFDKRMKPTYHNVRSDAIVNIQNIINSGNVEKRLITDLITSLDTTDAEKKKLKKNLSNINSRLYYANIKLKKERERIKQEHNF
jgi:prenyltransferase beta subunit